MQRVGTVSLFGAMILVLLCIAAASLWAIPAGAQAEPDPLADQTADIAAGSIGPIAVSDCQAATGETASITVADAEGQEQTFTDGAGGVAFRFGAQGITIAAQGGGDLDFDENFDASTGSVVSSEGITCGGGDAGGEGTGGARAEGACANAEEVASVDPTQDNSVTPFETTGRTFRVSYAVSGLDRFETVEIDIEGRFAFDFATVEQNGSDSFIVTEEAGSYELVVNIRPQNSARYTVTVEDCGGTGDGPAGDQYGDDDGDVDDPDDVVGGPKDDKPLPKTGGAPVLLGAAALALASALLARRILA